MNHGNKCILLQLSNLKVAACWRSRHAQLKAVSQVQQACLLTEKCSNDFWRGSWSKVICGFYQINYLILFRHSMSCGLNKRTGIWERDTHCLQSVIWGFLKESEINHRVLLSFTYQAFQCVGVFFWYFWHIHSCFIYFIMDVKVNDERLVASS